MLYFYVEELYELIKTWIMFHKSLWILTKYNITDWRQMLERLWVDKHRPKRLENLYHPEVSETLRDLAKTNDFPVNPIIFSIWFSMGQKEPAKRQGLSTLFKKFMERIH